MKYIYKSIHSFYSIKAFSVAGVSTSFHLSVMAHVDIQNRSMCNGVQVAFSPSQVDLFF